MTPCPRRPGSWLLAPPRVTVLGRRDAREAPSARTWMAPWPPRPHGCLRGVAVCARGLGAAWGGSPVPRLPTQGAGRTGTAETARTVGRRGGDAAWRRLWAAGAAAVPQPPCQVPWDGLSRALCSPHGRVVARNKRFCRDWLGSCLSWASAPASLAALAPAVRGRNWPPCLPGRSKELGCPWPPVL